MGEIKELDKNLQASFSKLKEDITDLKKSKKKLDKEVNELNNQQIVLEKDIAKKEDLHKMQMKVENIAYEQKTIKEFSDMISLLKKESILRKEYSRNNDKLKDEIKDLKKEVKKIKKSKDSVKESRIKELEKSLLKLDDVKQNVMKDVKKSYLTAEEVAAEINPLKKEFLDLYHKVNKVRKDLISLPKLRFFGDLMMLIALVSFAGAAVSVYFEFIYAANFLAIEGLGFFVISVITKIIYRMIR